MTEIIELKQIPNGTQNFIIDGDMNLDNFVLLAQKFDLTKHILHKNLNYKQSVKVLSRYVVVHDLEQLQGKHKY